MFYILSCVLVFVRIFCSYSKEENFVCEMDTEEDLKSFTRILRHFNLEQLKEIVFPELNFLSWEKVKRMVISEHLHMNKESVIKLIIQAWKVQMSRGSNLESLVGTIRLLDVSVHHNKHKWSAFTMTGNPKKKYYTSTEVQSSIESGFVRAGKIVKITVLAYNEIYWICVTERKRTARGSSVYKMPFFVACFPGQPYFFTSRAGKNQDNLHVICRSLGYNKAEDCSLSGWDIRHLCRFLRNAESGASTAEEVLWLVEEYRPDLVKMTAMGKDFTQRESKMNYVNQCFADEPTLQDLTVTSPRCDWYVEHIVPDIKEQVCEGIQATFRSPDVVKMFKEMNRKSILPTPLPQYIRKALGKGINNFNLKAN